MKVFELAKELDMRAIELVEKLKGMGMNVRNHMVVLTEEQIAKARNELVEADAKEKTTKKKTTKKKTAKKKTTTKKTTTRKVVRKSSKDEEKAEEPTPVVEEKVIAAEASEEAKTKKKVTRKKTTKVIKKKTVEEKAAAVAAEKAKEKDLYKEKVHSFTPVFIPEESDTKNDDDNADDINEKVVLDPLAEGEAKSKKRLGNLAAIVSKKSAAGKAKDLNQLRAEEELKFASTIVGSTVYTPAKRKKVYTGPSKSTEITEVKESKRIVTINKHVTAADLAQKLSQKFEKFQNRVLELNILISKEDVLGLKLAEKIAELYEYRVEDKSFDEQQLIGDKAKKDKSNFPLRDPIITVMGHVDHGKTTLLDHIRNTKVVDGEAGGITQHIGAYSVKVKKRNLTFLDTPGHAAFGAMRQRGANVTDIVILVVAADDGVMPQTKESIKFAQNANCPIIVAINKMDREGANPDRVKQELMEFNLTPEDWGGDTQFVPISALNGDGIDSLLEAVELQAEIMDLRENPKGPAEGVVIESKIEKGRGAVATILVQKGTLKKGDALVVGETSGRARSLMDYSGKMVNQAGPAIPVQVLGLNDPCNPGDILNVVKNEREARKVVDNRIANKKALENVSSQSQVSSLEDFFAQAGETGEKKVLKLMVRSDVLGSFEAIKNAVEQLGNDEVGVEVIGGGVGAITDNDVMMASSAGGYIFGFNMRPQTSARKLAEQQGVEIKTYSIIYELINDVKLALEGMLAPDTKEKYIGRAEVRQTFSIPKIGTIAGAAVIDGKIERGCNIRLLRDGKILHDGKLSTLKRFKDEVKEVKNGYECGIALENYNDIQENDIFEAYIMEETKRTLEENSEMTL